MGNICSKQIDAVSLPQRGCATLNFYALAKAFAVVEFIGPVCLAAYLVIEPLQTVSVERFIAIRPSVKQVKTGALEFLCVSLTKVPVRQKVQAELVTLCLITLHR